MLCFRRIPFADAIPENHFVAKPERLLAIFNAPVIDDSESILLS
jgi:hypothetical protein